MFKHLIHLKAALHYIFSNQARFSGKFDERDLLLGHGIDNLTSIRVVVAISFAIALYLLVDFFWSAQSMSAVLFIVVMEALCLYTLNLPRAGMEQALHSNFSKLNNKRSYRSYLNGRILFTPYGLSLSFKARNAQSISKERNAKAHSLLDHQDASKSSLLKQLSEANKHIRFNRSDKLTHSQVAKGLSKAQREHNARLYLANNGHKSAAMILQSGVSVDDYVMAQGILAATSDKQDLPVANSGYISKVTVPLLCDQRMYAGKSITMEAIAQILSVCAQQESETQKRSFVPTDLCLLGFGFEWLPKHSRALRQIMAVGAKAAPLGGDGSPDIHAVEVDYAYEPIVTSTNKLKGHTLLLGTTGSGKTRFFDLLVSQAIMRGDTVIVLDPKGDRDLQRSIIKAARAAEREPYHNLVCLDIGRPVSNPLSSNSAIDYAAASTGSLKQFAMDSQKIRSTGSIAPLSPFERSRHNLTIQGHLSLINEDFYERMGANQDNTPSYGPANANSSLQNAKTSLGFGFGFGKANGQSQGQDNGQSQGVILGNGQGFDNSLELEGEDSGALGEGDGEERLSFNYHQRNYIKGHNETIASLRAAKQRYSDPNFATVTDGDPDDRLFDEINFGLNPTSVFDRASEVASRLTSMVGGQGSSANFKAYAAMAITAAVECCRLLDENVTLDAIRGYIANHQKFVLAIRDIMNKTVVNLNNVYCSRYYNRLYGIKDEKLVRNAYTISVLMANGYKYINLKERATVLCVLEKSGLLDASDSQVEDSEKLQQIENIIENQSLTKSILADKNSKTTSSRSKKGTGDEAPKENRSRYLAAPAPIKALQEFYLWLTKDGYIDRDNSIEQVFEVCLMDPIFFQKVTNSIMPSLVSLTSGVLKQLLSADDYKQTSFMEIVRNNKIFYSALHCLKDSITGQNLGKLLMADLAYVAGEINAKNIHGHHQVSVFIDEASELANEVLVQLLNKSRASNFAVTIATQSVADLRARVNSKDAADQLIANCNNLLSLRVEDVDTANVIAKVLPNTVCTHESTTFSVGTGGLTGSASASRTLNQQDCEYFPATMLMQLPNFEFIARLANGSCYKGFIPIVDKDHSGYQRPSFNSAQEAQLFALEQNERMRKKTRPHAHKKGSSQGKTSGQGEVLGQYKSPNQGSCQGQGQVQALNQGLAKGQTIAKSQPLGNGQSVGNGQTMGNGQSIGNVKTMGNGPSVGNDPNELLGEGAVQGMRISDFKDQSTPLSNAFNQDMAQDLSNNPYEQGQSKQGDNYSNQRSSSALKMAQNLVSPPECHDPKKERFNNYVKARRQAKALQELKDRARNSSNPYDPHEPITPRYSDFNQAPLNAPSLASGKASDFAHGQALGNGKVPDKTASLAQTPSKAQAPSKAVQGLGSSTGPAFNQGQSIGSTLSEGQSHGHSMGRGHSMGQSHGLSMGNGHSVAIEHGDGKGQSVGMAMGYGPDKGGIDHGQSLGAQSTMVGEHLGDDCVMEQVSGYILGSKLYDYCNEQRMSLSDAQDLLGIEPNERRDLFVHPDHLQLDGPNVSKFGFTVGNSRATLNQETKVYVGNEQSLLYSHFSDLGYQNISNDQLSIERGIREGKKRLERKRKQQASLKSDAHARDTQNHNAIDEALNSHDQSHKAKFGASKENLEASDHETALLCHGDHKTADQSHGGLGGDGYGRSDGQSHGQGIGENGGQGKADEAQSELASLVAKEKGEFVPNDRHLNDRPMLGSKERLSTNKSMVDNCPYNYSPAPIMVTALNNSKSKMDRDYQRQQEAQQQEPMSFGISSKFFEEFGVLGVMVLLFRIVIYPCELLLKALITMLFNQSLLRHLSIAKELSFILLATFILSMACEHDKAQILEQSFSEVGSYLYNLSSVIEYALVNDFKDINQALYSDSSILDRFSLYFNLVLNHIEFALSAFALGLLWGNHYGLMAEMHHRSLLGIRTLLRPYSFLNLSLSISALALLIGGYFPCLEYALLVTWFKVALYGFTLTCFYSQHTK